VYYSISFVVVFVVKSSYFLCIMALIWVHNPYSSNPIHSLSSHCNLCIWACNWTLSLPVKLCEWLVSIVRLLLKWLVWARSESQRTRNQTKCGFRSLFVSLTPYTLYISFLDSFLYSLLYTHQFSPTYTPISIHISTIFSGVVSIGDYFLVWGLSISWWFWFMYRSTIHCPIIYPNNIPPIIATTIITLNYVQL